MGTISLVVLFTFLAGDRSQGLAMLFLKLLALLLSAVATNGEYLGS